MPPVLLFFCKPGKSIIRVEENKRITCAHLFSEDEMEEEWNSQHKQIHMFLVMFSVFGPVSFRRCFLCGYQSDPRPVPSGSTLFEILLLTSRGLPTSIYGLRDAWIQSWPFILDYINAASFMNSLIYVRFSDMVTNSKQHKYKCHKANSSVV